MTVRVFAAGKEITEDAVVYIELPAIAPTVTAGTKVRALNAKAIEEEAMQRMGWGSENSLGALILQVAAEVLDGSI